MDSQISSNIGSISYSPEQRDLSQARAAERARQVEETGLPPVEQMSPQEIKEHQAYLNRTLENIGRLRNPENLPAISARPVTPDRAGLAAGRLGDCKEAKELRNDYDFQNRTFDMIRDDAKKTAEKYGEGKHTIMPGLDVTVTKKNGHVSVTREFKPGPQGAFMPPAGGSLPKTGGTSPGSAKGENKGTAAPYGMAGYGMGMGLLGGASTTIEYDEKDSNFLRHSTKLKDGASVIERKGDTLRAHDFNGNMATYTASGDRLARTITGKDGITEKLTASGDGSAEIQRSGKGPDGKPINEKKTILRDDYKVSLGDYLKKHSSSIDDEGVSHPLKDDKLATLADGLSAFDRNSARQLMDEGLSFTVVNSKKTPKGGYPGNVNKWLNDATGKQPSGGWYSPREKTIVLAEERVDVASVYHEGAHALDDFREKDIKDPYSPTGKRITWHSDNDKELHNLYKNYQARSKKKDQVWSEYGRTNNKEYLAEGVLSYLSGPFSKESLREKDPEMYRYVEKFLKDSPK
jgi:hypothetical protein